MLFRSRIPDGETVLVIKRQRGPAGDESQVLWSGGAGWISDHCVLWEPINESL